jgi:uncharacterized protein YjiK
MDWFATGRRRRSLALAAVTAGVALAGAPASSHAAAPLTGVDLSTYLRVGRYDLPEPKRTTAPAGNLLAQEASGVTYDPDTGTLFIVGDGGTSVTQVDKTGHLIDSMTLPAGSSPQGTEFYDTEGITYAGGGKFVFTEERNRQLVRFTYVPNTTLTRAAAQTVKLGTTVGNVGLEGLTYDTQSGGFIVVKETDPLGIFQTGIDFVAGTATNGSPTTDESVNLFDPALAGVADFSDVFSLSNLPTLTGPDTSHLLIISQESGKIVNVDRSGHVSSSLTIPDDAGNPLSVPDQTHEGITMDGDGNIYTVSEAGGGDSDHPQLWVYAPSAGGVNAAPTAVTLTNQVNSIPETASTASRVKVADVAVTDDGQGTNALSVTGPDASAFEVDATGLYLKAGAVLNRTAKPSYSVSVAVDDASVGSTPDATSAVFTLTVAAAAAPPSLVVSEVSPWSSGNTPYAADWWEVTNTGTQAVDLTGYKMDDNSNAFANAVALTGVSTIAPGQSAIFVEGSATTANAFKASWFPDGAPAGFAIGSYSGSGVGLSTDGDAVNLFDAAGKRIAGVSFGASTSGFTFDNPTGLATVTALSVAGRNGAVKVGAETGSPGRIATPHVEVTAPGTLDGSVLTQLSLVLGPKASFGVFAAGVSQDYLAEMTATVTSTAGDAALSVADTSATAPTPRP